MGKERPAFANLQDLSWAVLSSTNHVTSQGSTSWKPLLASLWPTPHLPDKSGASETHSPLLKLETKPHYTQHQRPRVSSWEDSSRKTLLRQRNMARTILTPSTYSYSCNIIPKPREGLNQSWPNGETDEQSSPRPLGAVLGCRPYATGDLGPCVWSSDLPGQQWQCWV